MESDRRAFMIQTAGAMAAVSLWPELAGAAPRADITVGVIGCGRQGRAMLAELQRIDGVKIGAICDTDARRLASAKRRSRDSDTYDDHRRLLESAGVTAVFIATPTHLHREVAEDALKAGKDVYCEAPLASTVEDCAAIVAAARNSDRLFQCGLLARSNPVYQLARSFYRSDAVRTLVGMRAQRNKKMSWSVAADGARAKLLNWKLDPAVSLGLAGEWGTHQFDVFHWFTGRYPVGVRGAGSVRASEDGREVDDTVRCDLEFDDGTGLQWEATLANSYEGTHEVLFGTNATIRLAWSHGWMFKEADSPTQGWEVYANRQQFHNEEGITLIADATKLAAQGKLKDGIGLPYVPLYYGIADFLKSVTQGEPVVCGAGEGMRASIVGMLANQAVTTGEHVPIDPGLLRGE